MARDSRKRPQVPAGVVVRAVMEMVLFGQKSLLAVDQFGRTRGARRWHGSRRRLVVSDTTMQRSLSGLDLDGVRGALQDAWKVLENRGWLKARLPSGRRTRVGIVDGSDFGGFHGCAFVVSGALDAPVEIQMHEQGKELVAARMLLERLGRTMGRGAVDVVVADGLYMSAAHMQQCVEELGVHALIKTQEEGLTIIQDAEGLFRTEAEGIESSAGLDHKRSVRYRIKAAAGFRWQELPFALKVARVEEEHLKPRRGQQRTELFWAITTDQTLAGPDMRELAHGRWHIENNVFKRLNALVASKRANIQKERVKEALLLIWFMGLIALGFWMISPEARAAGAGAISSANWAAVKKTWFFVARMLCDSVAEMAGGQISVLGAGMG